MENKTIIRFLVFSGILLSIGFLLSQTVGLGAGGFDTATVLNQFNFYTAGIIYWIIVACFFFALLLMKKGN